MKKKNNYFYGIGTLGRDMVYALSSMFLIYFLTDVLNISAKGLAVVTFVMVVLRVFDALNDPFVGMLIDNTKSKHGKFRPWIILGSILSAICTILLFVDYQVEENLYLAIFTVVYLLWGITYTAHDISYWSMLPALSQKQKEREKIGSIAKICADVGIFIIVVGIIPITKWLSTYVGGLKQAYLTLAIIVSVLMVLFLLIMLSLVKEDRETKTEKQSTNLKEIFTIIFKNDQLIWVVLAMVLFTIANTTTTSFGVYYFKYIFGDEDIYSLFAIILGVSQLMALAVFPYLSQKIGRKKLYAIGTILVCIGYFFFYIAKDLLTVSIGGVLTFFGEGFIQILMLMFISDCVEYGEWKSGRRNDSVTLSLQPFIAKMGSALAAGIVGVTLLMTGIKDNGPVVSLSVTNQIIFKFSMLILPLIIIVIGYLIYRKKFIIDEVMYEKIVTDLNRRKEKRDILE